MKEFTIYGREDCAFCIKAIHLCLHNGYSFNFINITTAKITKEQLSIKINQPVRTVPQILTGSIYIGGSEDLETHLINMPG
ncbi:glutaredoxin domain-containing protein [Aliamphritea ceti]|uniref:glutaredoxin domain-containing protein n=1 Tax=Aliamphritea ceti TaxID=1524258 RepID=UPI0021C454B8|nr:glutaredoxin domain-containing protein [Aliamphritea ceti]